MESNSPIDYFISYTTVDEEWANWIAWQLEKMGHKTFLKAWDIQAGDNFVVKVDDATAKAKRTISVLSEEYLKSDVRAEWAVAYTDDPEGKKGKLVPIKVKPVDVTGLFKSIDAIDLIGLSQEEAKQKLLNKINASTDGIRNKPDAEPLFPGTKAESNQPIQNQTQQTQLSSVETSSSPKRIQLEQTPEFKAGLADKVDQAKHVFKWTGDQFIGKDKKRTAHSAFLLCGPASQWPYALIHRLYYEIKKLLKSNSSIPLKHGSPELVQLNGEIYGNDISTETHLWKLVSENLNCSPKKKDIELKLSKHHVPNIFYRSLKSDEANNPELVVGMLEAWGTLELPSHSPLHILVLWYEHSVKAKSWWPFWGKKTDSLMDKLKKTLPEESNDKNLLPDIISPTTTEIEDWIKSFFDPGDIQEVKDFIEDQMTEKYQKYKDDKKYANRIRMTDSHVEIHHHDLKSILIDAVEKFGN